MRTTSVTVCRIYVSSGYLYDTVSKGHAFLACMKKHDLLTRKNTESIHFS